VNTPHSPFAVGKTMETFHSDMSTYVKSCTRTRPRKSKWCRVVSWSVVVVSHSSLSSWSVVVDSRSSWSVALRSQSAFFLVVVVSRRGQSSWSVVVVSRSSWMVFVFYGGYGHVFT